MAFQGSPSADRVIESFLWCYSSLLGDILSYLVPHLPTHQSPCSNWGPGVAHICGNWSRTICWHRTVLSACMKIGFPVHAYHSPLDKVSTCRLSYNVKQERLGVLTLILCGPSSTAVAWVRPRTAHLLVPYAMTPAPDYTTISKALMVHVSDSEKVTALCPAVEQAPTILPPFPCLIICFAVPSPVKIRAIWDPSPSKDSPASR